MRYDINPYCSRAVGTYRTEGISRTRYISQIRQDLYRGAFAPYLPLATCNFAKPLASLIAIYKQACAIYFVAQNAIYFATLNAI